jgi:hypothetical protein
MSREDRLRLQLRARAWDVLAALPEEVGEGLAETVEAGGWEVTVLLRPAAPGPPPTDVLSLEPVQRFLPSCFLTDLELAVLAVLLDASERRTLAQLRDLAEARLSRPVADGQLKVFLARMTDASVGILTNDRHDRPAGYQVADGYRHFLAWVAGVRPGCPRLPAVA